MADVRVLTKEEWGLLEQAPDGVMLDPNYTAAVVATEDGKLVGRMFIVLMPHIEGTWVAESHRSGSVGYRLEKAAEELCKSMKVGLVAAYCEPEHETYMERLGFHKAPCTVWLKTIEAQPCQ